MPSRKGQVKTQAIGTDAFQEADTVGTTMPITKHNYLVKDPAELAHVVREAFYLARSGRPGAVLIDLPANISAAPGVWTERDMSNMRGYTPPEKGDPQAIARAADLINQAERPILYVGGGVIAEGQHLRGAHIDGQRRDARDSSALVGDAGDARGCPGLLRSA